jgi:hypothetical protein
VRFHLLNIQENFYVLLVVVQVVLIEVVVEVLEDIEHLLIMKHLVEEVHQKVQ